MFRSVLLRSLAVLVLLTTFSRAADPTTGFIDKVYKSPDGKESKYVVFVPPSYTGDKELPVLLFLHEAPARRVPIVLRN